MINLLWVIPSKSLRSTIPAQAFINLIEWSVEINLSSFPCIIKVGHVIFLILSRFLNLSLTILPTKLKLSPLITSQREVKADNNTNALIFEYLWLISQAIPLPMDLPIIIIFSYFIFNSLIIWSIITYASFII